MNEQKLLEQILANQKDEALQVVNSTLVERLAYSSALQHLNEPLVKVITGPRRAGKSIFAIQLCKDRKFAWINFDDDSLLSYLDQNGTLELIKSIKAVWGKFEILIIDEVQNLNKWELLINKLQRNKINLIITGSNANLLSQELSTHLTGRYIEIPIWTFSWDEYKKAIENPKLEEYIKTGGYPEIIISHVKQKPYLQTLADSIILKDIVRRYNIRHSSQIREIWSIILSQFAQKFTISSLAKILELRSKTTLQKYLYYLQSSYLMIELKRYSYKTKEQQKAPRKSYLVDTGYCEITPQAFDHTTRVFENLILLDLIRRYNVRYEIYYYITQSGKEVDFVVKQGTKFIKIIQVCYSIKNHSTHEREISAIKECAQELKCSNSCIITFSEDFEISISNDYKVPVVSYLNWIKSFDLI